MKQNIRKLRPTLLYRSLVTHSHRRLFSFYPHYGEVTTLRWSGARPNSLVTAIVSLAKEPASEIRLLKLRNQIRNLLRLIIRSMHLR